MCRPTKAFDIECYRNYFLVQFKDVETKEIATFELLPGGTLNITEIDRILRSCRVISFNGRNYDIPLLCLALTGADNAKLKAASDNIIVNQMKFWDFEKFYGLKFPSYIDHIDLIEVAPGKGSLKIYGGRLHSRQIQDLPIEPNAMITPEQRPLMRQYNGNDLDTTIDLFVYLAPQIDLRERMTTSTNIDLRSKSDAQIAEAVIKKRVENLLGERVNKLPSQAGRQFLYKKPDFIFFQTRELSAICDKIAQLPFTVAENGAVDLPEWLADLKIAIGSSVYNMGIGGLHSSEECAVHKADDDHVLVDRDVASYYPAIILALGLSPSQMGVPFLKVYKNIMLTRLAAKQRGDKVTSDAFKIVLNGSFGKFGSKYSYIYSPNLLIQTTITGQLLLLMLIEGLELCGISVVSANTDGVVIKCPNEKRGEMNAVLEAWELLTGFNTEETQYCSIYSRDVNSYVAVKKDGKVKTKGAFALGGLSKNPVNEICTEAAIEFIKNGTPVAMTIFDCDDVRKFVTVRACTGGAVKDGVILGKAVRWYYAKGETGTINYRVNGNIVARTLGAKPLMILPDKIPDDIDYAWYIAEAESLLEDVGAIPKKPIVKPERKKKNAVGSD